MRQFPCSQCGADMKFDPGVTSLACPFCGTENEIPESEEIVEELDYLTALQSAESGEEVFEQTVVACTGCGAETAFDPDTTSDECPFCGIAIVMTQQTSRRIKPRSLLPFKVERDRARELFRAWLTGLWFAPNDLTRRKNLVEKLQGVYVPYWTFDADTESDYAGKRGDYYWVTESYTTTQNGKTVHKTRQVRKIRWRSVSGRVHDRFDDVLVLASRALPRKLTEKLEPWDLENLVPYGDEYLSGFASHAYQLELTEGFDAGKEVMSEVVRSSVRRDIGGDRQRIYSVNTRYDDISFKHLLLPVWLSAYRYTQKVYHFVVNARTGEVQGQRPWSWVNILLAVLIVLAVVGIVAGIVAIANR